MISSSNSSDLSILIVSYNTCAFTLECLRSLKRETSSESIQVIVVDNASIDGSCDAIADEFKDVTLITLEENVGFAAANNLAAKKANGRYLLLLNPDTEIHDGAVDRLIEFAQKHPEARIWGGRTIFTDGSPNHSSCWNRQTIWSLVCQGFGMTRMFRNSSVFNSERITLDQSADPRTVDIVSGCFFLIERALWMELGGFDPAFFMYGEEADLCLRARRLGVQPMVEPKATIVHHGGSSERVRADKLVRLFRAKTLLAKRHIGWFGGLLAKWMFVQTCLINVVRWRVLSILRFEGAGIHAQTWVRVLGERQQWINTGGSPRSSCVSEYAKTKELSDATTANSR